MCTVPNWVDEVRKSTQNEPIPMHSLPHYFSFLLLFSHSSVGMVINLQDNENYLQGGNKCTGAEDNGVSILHGNALAFVKVNIPPPPQIFLALLTTSILSPASLQDSSVV